MAEIKRFVEDVVVHQKLSDAPNVMDGYSADDIKRLYDSPAVRTQEYINDSLIPDVEGYVNEVVADVVVGKLPEGSVTTEKLADEAVTTEKIANEAITKGKLSPDVAGLLGKAIGDIDISAGIRNTPEWVPAMFNKGLKRDEYPELYSVIGDRYWKFTGNFGGVASGTILNGLGMVSDSVYTFADTSTGYFRRSINRGASWVNSSFSGLNSNYYVNGIFFYQSTAIAIGGYYTSSNGYMYYWVSNDAGASWTQVTYGSKSSNRTEFALGAALGKRLVSIYNSNAYVPVYTDMNAIAMVQGNTYSYSPPAIIASEVTNYFYYFRNSSSSGSAPVVSRSSDGVSWSDWSISYLPFGQGSVSCSKTKSYFAMGASGGVVMTSTDGLSWGVRYTFSPTAGVAVTVFTSPDTFIAIASDGRIYEYSFITNTGRLSTLTAPANLTSAFFDPDANVVMARSASMIYRLAISDLFYVPDMGGDPSFPNLYYIKAKDVT